MSHAISNFVRRNYLRIRILGTLLTVLGLGAAITGGCAKYYREQDKPILGHSSTYEILLLTLGALLAVVGAVMLSLTAVYKQQPLAFRFKVSRKEDNQVTHSIIQRDESSSPDGVLDTESMLEEPLAGAFNTGKLQISHEPTMVSYDEISEAKSDGPALIIS